MLWPYPGKHKGDDINNIPDDYLQWCADSSKNPEAMALAKKALAYRNGDKPAGSKANGSTSSNDAGLRAKVLDLAIKMDAKKVGKDPNPWLYLKPIKDYIESGQLPTLASMLGDEKKPNEPDGGDPFDLASDDEPPF